MPDKPEAGNAAPCDGVIAGGGISGLALAHWLGLHENPGTWQIWESASRLGGTIGTDRTDGWSIDWGPNGFLDREPLTLQLVDEAGMTPMLERANEKAGERFIAKNGRLHPVPLSPLSILTTGLLRPSEKLRIFLEPFIAGRSDDADETVFDFAARRIGRGAAETFVDPMVSGIFGGVARELSLPACFPVMREMELKHGGLVRAMIARMLEKRRRGNDGTGAEKKSGGPAGPAGRLTSFHGGLDALVSRLGERLKPSIRLGREVHAATRAGDLWRIEDGTGGSILSRRIVFACPTFAAADAVRGFDPELAGELAAIPYAPIAVVATGHRRGDIRHPLDGFGFLIPRSQGLRTLGSIWTSSIFADRAPAGHVQFRTMLGGAGDPSVTDLSDDELWSTIRRELDPLIGIEGEPVLFRVYRWRRGIPQFVLGHRARRARIEALASRHAGLHLVGNAYYGVGLNDCVKMARRVAEEIKKESAQAERGE